MFTTPTVKVANPDGGFMVINEEDFDPKKHELVEEDPDSDDGATEDDEAGGDDDDETAPASETIPTKTEINKMNKTELKAVLRSRDVAFSREANVAELLDMVRVTLYPDG